MIVGIIISSYKVLHSATALKYVYNRLDENMLLTAIVRNSLINETRFNTIKSCVMSLSRNVTGGRR